MPGTLGLLENPEFCRWDGIWLLRGVGEETMVAETLGPV